MTNALVSIAAGADLVHGTINGIGERAGNVALEEVAIALDHGYGVESMALTEVYDLAQLIANRTGIPLAPNKAVVGENAFTHESGIHTDGTLKDDSMYEPYPPEKVGRERRLALGKHAAEPVSRPPSTSTMSRSPMTSSRKSSAASRRSATAASASPTPTC